MNRLRGVPGWKRWRRDRRQGLGILMIMSLGCFLLAFTFLFGDSLEATLEARRKEAYGEWQYACLNLSTEEETKVSSIPFVSQKGCLWSAGILSGQETYYGIGGMDAEAAELSHIRIREGHLPEQKGEIALEKSMIRILGLSGRLGEKVSFSMDPAEGNAKKILGAESRKIEGTLCGILEDYSNSWYISSKALIPSILLTADSIPDFTWPAVRNLLITGVPEWSLDAMKEDLRGLDHEKPLEKQKRETSGENTEKEDASEKIWVRESDKYVRNKFLYPEETFGNTEERMQEIRILILVLMTGVSVILVGVSVKYRREEWQQLVRLGAEIRQLRKILIQEAALFLGLSLMIGLVSVLLLFRLLLPVLSRGFGFPFLRCISWLHLAEAAGMDAMIAMLSYLFPVLRMRTLAALEERAGAVPGQKNACRRIRGWISNGAGRKIRGKRPGRDHGIISFRTIFLRPWIRHPGQKLLQFLLLVGMLLVPCIGIRAVSENVRLLRGEEKNYGNSYTGEYTGGVESADGLPGGVSSRKLEGMDDIYGVASHQAYRLLDAENLFLADFSAWKQTEYLTLQKEMVQNQLLLLEEEEGGREESAEKKEAGRAWEDGRNQGILPVSVIGTDSIDTLRPYLESLAEGNVDEKAFIGGEEVILFLPDLIETEYEGERIIETSSSEEQAMRQEEKGSRRISESSIKPGDSLTLSWRGEKKTVTVAGIIRWVREENYADTYNRNEPCQILCSENLLNGLLPESADTYQYVKVNADMEAGYGTDTQIAKFLYGVKGMEYVNHRQKIEDYRQELSTQALFYLMLCGAGTCLLAVIFSGIVKLEIRYQREQMEVFEALGIRSSWKVLFTYLDQGILSLLSVLSVMIFFSVLDTIQTNQKLASWGAAERISFRIRVGFDLRIFAMICVGMIGTHLVLAGLRMRRKKKS